MRDLLIVSTICCRDLRAEADNRISGFIDAINSDLGLIKGLNEQIGQRTAAEKSTADLEDKRDQLLLSVNKNISIGSFKRSNNRLTISTADGRLLLDDTQIPMAFSATSSFTEKLQQRAMVSRWVERISLLALKAGTAFFLAY